ncbi:MAG TPA: right-handed parallel beta-helix repeat-containing protein [Mycobacteriales bacterium]|nr:right-handed parallel beta-helix repeat-containing protein [Mycobacteriales bacterium]
MRLPRRRGSAAVAAAAAALALAAAPGHAVDTTGCAPYSGSGAGIAAAVAAHDCVALAPGTYLLPRVLVLPVGHDLVGTGTTRAGVVVRPGSAFPDLTLVRRDVAGGDVSRIEHLTLDGRLPDGRRLPKLVLRSDLAIDDVVLRETTCYALGIQGYRVTVRHSLFERNGLACPNAPPGAGIYAVAARGSDAVAYAPVIEGNEFRRNVGPGADIAGVRNGVFRGNHVHDNAGYAGLALFGAKGWLVERNTVFHAATEPGYPYSGGRCDTGPGGLRRPAAVLVCQKDADRLMVTTRNVIRDNRLASYWGLLLVGNDEAVPYWAPRANVVAGNTTTGSRVGCADDFRPGQWFADDNVWTANSCGRPVYF